MLLDGEFQAIMIHFFKRTVFILFLLTGAAVSAQPVPLLAAPEVAANAYLLIDVTANQILASRKIDDPIEPASLTKLMTAYVIFDALKAKKIDLKQTMPVSERAWKMPGSRMFIDPKMQVPVEDLIKGMIVQSGNDAVMALAEGVGGSAERFVQMMNAQAQLFGMKNTAYKNPEGLTQAGHTTTARDLGVLSMRLMRDFPEYTHFYAIKKYRYQGTPVTNDINRNLLLFRDSTVDGLKTGYTDAAGYCLIATAKRDFAGLGLGAAVGSRRMLAIVLGASSENERANEAQKLLNWGYTAYEAVKLFDVGQAVVAPKIWKGADNTIRLGQPGAIVVVVPTGSASRLKTSVIRPEPLLAPINKGQQIGVLKVGLDQQNVLDIPLIALDTIQQAGLLGRAWDAIRLWIK